MNKNPIIGVTPLYESSSGNWWIEPAYMKGLLEFGAVPILLPFDSKEDDVQKLTDLVDGLLFTGGQDVNPALYGESCRPEIGVLTPIRDVSESQLYRFASQRDLPMLGICRGHQFLNVMRGGTLFQDLPTMRPSDIHHRQPEGGYRQTHTNDIVAGSPLAEWLDGASEMEVNSFHHQAVKTLGQGLKAMAYAQCDHIVEAYYDPDKRFFVGVQWHPEMLRTYQPAHKVIFREFVKACRDRD